MGMGRWVLGVGAVPAGTMGTWLWVLGVGAGRLHESWEGSMREFWCMVHGAWCMVHDAWCMGPRTALGLGYIALLLHVILRCWVGR